MGPQHHCQTAETPVFYPKKVSAQYRRGVQYHPTAALQVIEGLMHLHIKAKMQSTLFKMLLLSLLVFIAALLQASSASPVPASKKPRPVNLSYSCMRVTGKGDKRDDVPVILLHGLGLSKESWMGVYQLLALKTKKRVCIVDLRNHGDSPWSDQSDIASMAEDIKQLMGRLKAEKAIVLGHSMGGKAAVHFTLTYPDNVEKLIVEDMRPNGLTPRALEEVQVFLALLQKTSEIMPQGVSEKEAKRTIFKFLNEQLEKLNDTSALLNPKVVDFLPIRCRNGKCAWKTNTQLVKYILKDFATLLNESSGRYDGPTLFVYGTASPFKVNEDESNIKKLFPNAKLVGIEGASHVVHEREEFVDTVIRFINGK
ncbi:Protein ABHD11 [Araneus ventricosus]|uniref:sn-1-specific diacylglycerol lipase ABHD11 n=1 Tax=Araneus ventricosus TaxID=182803 RepID=A0A4Y2B652_ARAVE|nr:Protein ABHD11 [Araneus ventricosus]